MMRGHETMEIPVYKLLWRDMYRISPVLAWVWLFAFGLFVAFIVFASCMAVVAAYEESGCWAAVAVAAFIGVLTIVGLFGMLYQLVVPIPCIEDEKEIEE